MMMPKASPRRADRACFHLKAIKAIAGAIKCTYVSPFEAVEHQFSSRDDDAAMGVLRRLGYIDDRASSSRQQPAEAHAQAESRSGSRRSCVDVVRLSFGASSRVAM